MITRFGPTTADYDLLKLSMGQQYPQIRTWNINASSSLITTTEYTVWPYAGAWTPVGTAATIDVVSDSTDDDAAGIGARTVQIVGVDDSGDIVNEVIDMDGTTTVNSTNDYYSLLSAKVLTVGGSGQQGTITLEIGGSREGTILSELREAQGAKFTVPTGYYAFMQSVAVNVLTSSTNTTKLYLNAQESSHTATDTQERRVARWVFTEGHYVLPFTPSQPLEPDSTFHWSAITSAGTADVAVQCGLVLVSSALVNSNNIIGSI